MTLTALQRLCRRSEDSLDEWDSFFSTFERPEVRDRSPRWRAFGDGGYLDNKPFTFAVEALCERCATRPLERKLLYVEPSPEQVDVSAGGQSSARPDAISNALAALTSIPQYETIREDLQAVLNRNRRIERIERIVRLGENAIRSDGAFEAVILEKGEIPKCPRSRSATWSPTTAQRSCPTRGCVCTP
jgi:hypothetical protein